MTTIKRRPRGRQVLAEAGLDYWTRPEPEQAERVGKATRKRKKKVKR